MSESNEMSMNSLDDFIDAVESSSMTIDDMIEYTNTMDAESLRKLDLHVRLIVLIELYHSLCKQP